MVRQTLCGNVVSLACAGSLALFLLGGCGDVSRSYRAAPAADVYRADQSESMSGGSARDDAWKSSDRTTATANKVPSPRELAPNLMRQSGLALTDTSVDGEAAAVEDEPVVRKIIYNGELLIVVEDFSKADAEVARLIAQYNGYVQLFRTDAVPGVQQAGTWTIRVPAENFAPMMTALQTLGNDAGRKQEAQDVSEEFVDLEARLANKRRSEERVLEIIERKTGDIEDVLSAENHLANIREEIERIEGRLKFLAHRSALSTITLRVHEMKNYQPPQAVTFGSRISNQWQSSLGALQTTGENAAVWAVGAAPWLAVWAVILTPFGLWIRYLWKRPRKPSMYQRVNKAEG